MNHLSTLHRYSGGFSNSGPGGVSLLTILFVVLGALASASAQLANQQEALCLAQECARFFFLPALLYY
jgi:hypothetical protein